MKNFILFTITIITTYSHLYSMKPNIEPNNEEDGGYSIQQLLELGRIDQNYLKQNPDRDGHSLTLQRCNIQCIRGISLIPNITDNAPYITEINLSKNKFSDLPIIFFDQLFNLRTLNLSNNQINSLPKIKTCIAKRLEYVNLSNNKLITIPKSWLSKTLALKHLYLQNNKLSILPNKSFSFTPKLKVINLSNNKLTFLPKNFLLSTPKLIVADFSKNQLSALPKRFFSFDTIPNLLHLTLHENSLVSISNNQFLKYARCLYALTLHKNNLIQLPDNFLINTPRLEVLTIQNEDGSVPLHSLLSPKQQEALQKGNTEFL